MNAVKDNPRAVDVMTNDPVCVTSATTLRELADVFRDNEISGAPVVDQQGSLVGVVSKTDLLRKCTEGAAAPAYFFEVLAEQSGDEGAESTLAPEPDVCVEDLMTEDPVTVSPGTPAAEIARMMFDRRVHRVVVIDDSRCPVGIVTSLDLLGLFPALRRSG